MADQIGNYTATLVVNDGYLDSEPDTVIISVEGNSKPVADAGEDRDVNVGQEVCLDGSGSSDPNGDDITYSCAITSRPDGSDANVADLDDPGKVNPCFTPDVSGTYLVQFIVTDEHGLSGEPVTVTITATEGEEPALGDLNGNNVVDMADLNIILSHRNQSVDVCPECDLYGDGMITALDARKLVLLCTCPRCVCP
jgi:PKD repeat protein